MNALLEDIAKQEGKENEISLQELEKHFDDITKDEKNDERQIAKLIKALEKNVDKKESKKYGFDSKGIIQDIIDNESDISKYNENTIKVYQLCKILEGDKNMIIDGKIGNPMIYDKVEWYKQQGVGLLSGESLNYNQSNGELVFASKIFGPMNEMVQEPYTIIDNIHTCKDFLVKKRQSAFYEVLKTNAIQNNEGEAITLSDSGIMHIDISNDAWDIQMQKSVDITSMSDKMNIITIILEQRATYEAVFADKKKAMEERMKINNEISNEISIADYTENLEKFGITGKVAPNWVKILTDIATSEDISKITSENIGAYLPLPETVKESDKPYICLNFKSLLLQYITAFPGYESPLLIRMEKSSEGEMQMKNFGLVTGVNLANMEYGITYYTSVIGYVEKLQTKGSETEKKLLAGTLDLSNPLRKDAFKLYVLSSIDGKEGEEINNFLENIFAGRTAGCLSEKGLFVYAFQDTIIGWLNSGYVFSKVQPYILSGNSSGSSYTILDMNSLSKYERYIGKGNEDIDNLYTYTKAFYEQGKPLGIDPSIPIDKIMNFYKYFEKQNKNITDLENAQNKELKENFDLYHGEDGAMMGGDNAINGFVASNNTIMDKYSGRIYDATIALEKEYVMLLQLKTPKPTGKVPSLSGKVNLDFSKGPNPDDIVRNSFGERVSDQWDQFVDDLYNNRQRAFGSFTGMVLGVLGGAAAGALTKGNVWATGAGFTIGLRLGNGIGQEVWNTGEWLYESTGGEMSGTNNKVDPFGVGFMRGVGAYNDKDERVGTASFIGGLGFDYISTVATFGIGSKFAPFMEKIRGLGGLGGKVMVFGIEELFIESFLVDIPLNILQTGIYTFAGIGDGPIVGQTVLGNETSSGGTKKYESGNFVDALLSMKDATEKNFSFDNLCQVFFNTVAYGGLLEGGSLGIGKIKTYMSTTEVNKFESTTKKSQEALNDMNTFLSKNNIIVDPTAKSFVDANTHLPIAENDPRIAQLTTLLKDMETLKNENLAALEELKIKQQEVIQNPKDKKGIFFRLGLINGYLTPAQMIEERTAVIDKKIQEEKDKIAKGMGDTKVLSQLEALRGEYEYAKTVLLEGNISNVGIEGNVGSTDVVQLEEETVPDVNQDEKFDSQNIETIEYVAYLKNICKEKSTAMVLQVPVKGGVCEYVFINENGNARSIDPGEVGDSVLSEVVLETFKESLEQDVGMFGEGTVFVLKTPYGFSKDKKLPGDLDYATDIAGMKNILHNLYQQSADIEHFEFTLNMDQKMVLGKDSDGRLVFKKKGSEDFVPLALHDMFSADGVLNGEIENFIEHGYTTEDGKQQRMRISYDMYTDLNTNSLGLTKGSVNREIFVEDGTRFFEVDPEKSIMFNINGVEVPMLSPEGYIVYSSQLCTSDFKKEFDTKSSNKFKIAKRIGDFVDGFQKLPGNEAYLSQNMSEVFIVGIESFLAQDPTNKDIQDLLVRAKEVKVNHDALPSGGKTIPENIGDFMTETNSVKELIVEINNIVEHTGDLTIKNDHLLFEFYLDEKGGEILDFDNLSEDQKKEYEVWKTKDFFGDNNKISKFEGGLRTRLDEEMKVLDGYDYSGKDNYAHYFDYYTIKNSPKYVVK